MTNLTRDDYQQLIFALVAKGYVSNDNPLSIAEFRHGFKTPTVSPMGGKESAFTVIFGEGVDIMVHGVFREGERLPTLLGVTELAANHATIAACLALLDGSR